jgi:uncharacterized protein
MINPPPEIRPFSPVPTPAPKPWGGWATIGLGAVVLVVYVTVQGAVALAFALWRFVENPGLDVTQLTNDLASDGFMLSIATISSAILGTGFILLFIFLRKRISISDYLNLHPLPRKSLLTLLGVYAGLLVISVVLGLIWPQIEDSGFTVEVFNTSRWPALFGIAVVVFAPIFEETFFRGFLFRGLKDSALGATGTILLTSLLWALLHVQYNFFGIAEIFILGIVFGIVRLRTGSLQAPLLLHALWNLAAFVAAALSVNH